jgi:glycosyltransferase involved in cell wall biosynthesis
LASSFGDFEVIVVDDQSTDRSAEIASGIADSDDRVRFELNPQNLGDYGNRMKAAALARGKFLKYVDSDDLIYPHSLQIMVDCMEKYSDAALGLAHSLPEDDSPYPWCLSPAEAYRKHFLGRGCMSCGPTGAIIRRDALESVGGFRQQWGVLSDTDLWYRLAAEYPIVLLPPGLVWWRRHDDQQFTKDNADEVYLRRGYELDVAALRDHCPLSDAERQRAIDRKKHTYARRILALGIRRMKPAVAWKLFHGSDLTLLDLARGLSPHH